MNRRSLIIMYFWEIYALSAKISIQNQVLCKRKRPIGPNELILDIVTGLFFKGLKLGR